jgi:hypothetical protein
MRAVLLLAGLNPAAMTPHPVRYGIECGPGDRATYIVVPER